MTVMAEIKENIVFRGNGEADEALAAIAKDDFALVTAYENALKSFQPVDVTDGAEADGGEKPEQADRPADTQQAAEEETVCPAAAEPSAQPKWAIGAPCQAVWSEDGQLYGGTLVWLDGQRCRVRFDGYGNEEDMDVSDLKSPDASQQTQRDEQVWKAGARCRAVYSEDGLVYPAVLLWVRGERCMVRFDGYNNEEEQDVSGLLAPDELNGPSRAASAKAGAWRPSPTGGSSDWRRRRREESQADRERRPAWRDETPGSSAVKDRSSKSEKDAADRRGNIQKDGAEKPAGGLFSFFPPVPPPPNAGSADVSFVPPPPPPLCGRKEASGGADVDVATLSSMLMSWYMCGFHTGSYMAQQQCRTNCHRPASSKD